MSVSSSMLKIFLRTSGHISSCVSIRKNILRKSNTSKQNLSWRIPNLHYILSDVAVDLIFASISRELDFGNSALGRNFPFALRQIYLFSLPAGKYGFNT